MKKVIKRTAVTALTGIMAAGMLTGCGDKAVDPYLDCCNCRWNRGSNGNLKPYGS